MLVIGLSAGRWLLQFAVVYTWLVFSLSRFEVTRGVNEKLTGIVITPVSALMGRIASAIPILIVAAVVGVAVWVLLRFVGMFFATVERGETKFGWLPAELAAPTSLLLRIAIVAAALVFAAPLVTGDPEGALARSGAVVLIALGLASTPLLTTVIVGATVIYARRLKPGTWTEIGGRTGRVRSVGLLSVELEESDGGELRIPHLFVLVKPTRLLHSAPRAGIVVTVAPTEKAATVSDVLTTAASRVGTKPEVDVLRADADGIDFRVTVSTQTPGAGQELQLAVLEAIQQAKIRLGRGRASQA
jgi:small-conductance mechanosensitive channel